MRRFGRPLPDIVLTIVVVTLLGVFIVYPIVGVLGESFVIARPMSNVRLGEMTQRALDVVPAKQRADEVANWAASATPAQRIDAMSAAYELAGVPVDWNRQAAYADQARALDASLAHVTNAQRAGITSRYPLAVVMLFKRIALAFQVRNAVGEASFDRLRNGVETRLGLDQYWKIFSDPYLRSATANSIELALVSTIVSVAIAFALSYGIHSRAIPWPGFTRGVMLLPLVAPPVLVALATLMLFGRNGLVTHGLLEQWLGLIDTGKTNIYGFSGVVAAQVLSHIPAALIVLDNVLARGDGHLNEAASGLGAGRWLVMRHVTVPLAWPGIKRAIVLMFILSMTDFANPMLLGRGMPVLAGVVYDQITAYQNQALAAALCIWMLLPALALHLALEWIGRRRRFATNDAAGTSEVSPPFAWRIGLTALAGCLVVLITAVYATMLAGAFVHAWGSDWTPTMGYFTRAGADVGLTAAGFGSSDRGLDTVWDSLRIAGIAAPIGGVFALLVAYVVERVRPPGADVLSFLALIPALLPGIIFGVGYIAAFNVPLGFKSLSLSGTAAILILNIVFSKIYVGVLAARAALQRYDRSIEEAAESLGAGLLTRIVFVALPMLRSALLLGTLYVFVEGMTTLSSVIFLVSGNHRLASVAIFNHAMSNEFGYAAAKSVVIFGITVAAMALVWRIEAAAATSRGRATAIPRDSLDGAELGQAHSVISVSRLHRKLV